MFWTNTLQTHYMCMTNTLKTLINSNICILEHQTADLNSQQYLMGKSESVGCTCESQKPESYSAPTWIEWLITQKEKMQQLEQELVEDDTI